MASLLGGTEGIGFTIAMSGLNGGRLNIAAASLGGAQAAFDKAASYVADRPGVRWRVDRQPTIALHPRGHDDRPAHLAAHLWAAATALDEGRRTRSSSARWPKRYVTDTCFTVADQALQL